MKHALILSGGGFKGSYQVGALKFLLSQIKFDLVGGTSVGSLNGIFIAMDKFEELVQLWETVIATDGDCIFGDGLLTLSQGKLIPNAEKIEEQAMKGISKFELVSRLINKKKRKELITDISNNILSSTNLITNDPLKELLTKNVKLADVKTLYYHSIVSFYDKKLTQLSNVDYNNDKDFVNSILASSTMPGLLKPIPVIRTKKGNIFQAVDGGLRDVTPFSQAFDYAKALGGEWTFWAINCSTSDSKVEPQEKTIPMAAGLTIDILLNEVFVNDNGMAIKVNEIADCLGKEKYSIRTVQPRVGDLFDTLDTRELSLRHNIELGYLQAKDEFELWQASQLK